MCGYLLNENYTLLLYIIALLIHSGLLSKADDGKRQGQVTVTWSDAILKSLRTASSVNAEAGQGPNKSSHISTLLHLTSLCQPTLIERFNLINLAYDATQTESKHIYVYI